MIKTNLASDHQQVNNQLIDYEQTNKYQKKEEHSTETDFKKQHDSQKENNVNKIVDELVSLISLPKITKDYIDKMKSIVHTSNNKKEVHKYTKWVLCMTYLIPIIKMYLMNDNNVKYFIERHKSIANNGVVAVQNGSITYYDIFVPKSSVNFDHIKHDIDKNILNFVINLINDTNSKEHKILSKMTEHIFLVVCRSDKMFNINDNRSMNEMSDMSDEDDNRHISFCWQFKDSNEKQKIEKMVMKKKSQLISQLDRANLHIRYDQNEIVAQLMSVKDMIDVESENESSSYHQSSHEEYELNKKSNQRVHQMPLRKPIINDKISSSQDDDASSCSDENTSHISKEITATELTSTTHSQSSKDNISISDKIKNEHCESLGKQIKRFKHEDQIIIEKDIIQIKPEDCVVNGTNNVHNMLSHPSTNINNVHIDHNIINFHTKNMCIPNIELCDNINKKCDDKQSQHPVIGKSVHKTQNKITQYFEDTSVEGTSIILENNQKRIFKDIESNESSHSGSDHSGSDQINNKHKYNDSQEVSVLENDYELENGSNNENYSSIVTENNSTITNTNTSTSDKVSSCVESSHDPHNSASTDNIDNMTRGTDYSDNTNMSSKTESSSDTSDITTNLVHKNIFDKKTNTTNEFESIHVHQCKKINKYNHQASSRFIKNAHMFNVNYCHNDSDISHSSIQKPSKNKMNVLIDILLSGIILYVYMICSIIKYFFTIDCISTYHHTFGLPDFIMIRLPKIYFNVLKTIEHNYRNSENCVDVDDISDAVVSKRNRHITYKKRNY